MKKKYSVISLICIFLLTLGKMQISLAEDNTKEGTSTQIHSPNLIPPLPIEVTPQVVSKEGIKIFGMEIFAQAPSIFEPVIEASVGPDYIIGPEDNLIIELWGKFETVYNLVVDRDGKIFIPNVGAVYVYGLSLTQLQKLLQEKFAMVYTNFKMNITLGKLRTIKVFVVGEVTRPGAYTLSALATAFNAIYAAGGPTPKGSMREIKLIRENKLIDTIDLYKFLLEGDKSQDHRLSAGDTIFIPLRETLVGITGEVNRPAMYELKKGTNLSNLIKMAGGVKPTGYLHRVQVERIQHHEKNIIEDIELDTLYKDENKDIELLDGDFILIFPIPKQTYKYVELAGMVERPGRYALKEKMTIGNLLELGKLLKEAYLERVDIIRTYKDKHQEVISINLKEEVSQGLELQEWDKVIVYSKWELEPRPQVNITGLVKNPGVYELLKDMQISDLIYQAGGITKDIEIIRAEIIRTSLDEQIEVIPVNINALLKGDKTQEIKLQQFDRVCIYSVFEPEPIPLVRITGLVRKPGTYQLSKGMKISDLISRASGLDKSATLLNAELSRMEKTDQGVSFTHIPIDLEKIMIDKDINADIFLQEDDHLFIRQIPKWRVQDTVSISGEVRFPGTYTITENEKLSSVLKRAGGFTKEAFLPGVIFTRVSVKEWQEKEAKERFLLPEEEVLTQEEVKLLEEELSPEKLAKKKETISKKRELLKLSMAKIPKGRVVIKLTNLNEFENSNDDIILQEGDSIFIPKIPISVMVIGEVYNPGSILCHRGKDVAYYINIAGGITKNADKSEIYILKPDGNVQKRGFFGPLHNIVTRGDIIVVPLRIEKGFKWKDIVEVIYQLATTIAVIVNILK